MNKWRYGTPDGFDDMVMAEEDGFLTGLCFLGTKDASGRCFNCTERKTDVLAETCRWLDIYFKGGDPGFTPPMRMAGLTPFRREVLEAVRCIPFGATVSYGDIARSIAERSGRAKVSARAVGGAVGWNPICVIVPCHRVIGADGGLTGYGGGLRNKIALLANEGVETSRGASSGMLRRERVF